MDQRLLRPRRLEQGVAAGRHLAQPHADGEHQVGVANARRQLRIDADADIAGIQRMAVVEAVLEAESAAHRQLPVLGEALQRGAGLGVPAAAAGDDDRPLGREQHAAQLAQPARRRPGQHRLHARQHRRRGRRRQHVLGQGQHHRAGPALQRGVEGARDVLGQAVGALHLAHPLGQPERAGAEHLPVVDLLEGLAVALVARDLADEQDHRRRILERGVQPDAGVGGAGPARDEADAGAAAELALRLGHEGGAAFLPAGDEADAVAVLVEAVEHREVAFAGDAEAGGDALGDQGFDEGVAGEAARV